MKLYEFFLKAHKVYLDSPLHQSRVHHALKKAFLAILRLYSRQKKLHFPPYEEWSWVYQLEMLVGRYEQETVLLCREIVQQGMLVVDIGAHIGYYTRLLSQLVGDTGKVWAFEPTPKNHDILLRNTQKLKNCEVVKKAVSDFCGFGQLHLTKTAGEHSLIKHGEVVESIPVETITLDEFVSQKGFPQVHLVKIDVEGSEMKVIHGMTEVIRRNPNLMLIVEYCPDNIRAAGFAPREFIHELENLGFRVNAIQNGGVLAPIATVADIQGRNYVNLFCRRSL